MSYREPLPPEWFSCEADGCSGQVLVTDQAKLGYHRKTGVEPTGRGLCRECETKVRMVTIPCCNKSTGVEGDGACLGDGMIHLYERNEKAAYWYVKKGCSTRPSMHPYCDVCRRGIVFRASCRNQGCRGDGTLHLTGDQKYGLVKQRDETGEQSWWPPKNCEACRAFRSSLRDRALTCGCCKRPWLWTAKKQEVLLITEPRSHLDQPPTYCPACQALSQEDRKELHRRTQGEERRRLARREIRALVRTTEGREALRRTSRDRFLTAAHSMFRAPDRSAVSERMKAAALTRVDRVGGQEGTESLRKALDARGTDAGRIASMLANHAIRDDQAKKVTRALGKLAAGGRFPPGFSERLKVRGGLGMTTGLAGAASTVPRIAQASAYEVHAAAEIADNPRFPYPFSKDEIATFHYRFQHNRYCSMSGKRSFEGDIVIQHREVDGYVNTFVDFKHSVSGRPSITRDELERIFTGLTHGVIDRAVIVSNRPLASQNLIDEFNGRLDEHNRQHSGRLPSIRTFVQGW